MILINCICCKKQIFPVINEVYELRSKMNFIYTFLFAYCACWRTFYLHIVDFETICTQFKKSAIDIARGDEMRNCADCC